MNLEEVKQKIAETNAKSEQLNKERQTNIGKKETYKTQLEKALTDYKAAYGVDLTVENLTAELERVRAEKEKELALVEGMIACINNGDYNGARELAGEPPVEDDNKLSLDTTATTETAETEEKPKKRGRKKKTEEDVAPTAPTPEMPTPVAVPTPVEVPTPVAAPTPAPIPTAEIPTPMPAPIASMPTPAVAPVVPTPTAVPTPVPAPVAAPTEEAVTPPTPPAPMPAPINTGEIPSVPTPAPAPTPVAPAPMPAPVAPAPLDGMLNGALDGFAPANATPPTPPTDFQSILGGSAFSLN